MNMNDMPGQAAQEFPVLTLQEGFAQELKKLPKVERPLRSAFGIDTDAALLGYAEETRFTPPKDPFHIWNMSLFRDMMYFQGSQYNCIRFTGDRGTGKSSFVEQFHACLNLPLLCDVGHPEKTFASLIGGYMPGPNGLEWRWGAVGLAAKLGLPVLITEWNLMSSAVAASMNPLLENRAIFVESLGDIVRPAPGFLVYLDDNPSTGLGFHGREAPDPSSADRMFTVEVTWMPEALERQMIKARLHGRGVDVESSKFQLQMDLVMQLTLRVRKAHSAGELPQTTISSRTVVHWLDSLAYFSGYGDEIEGESTMQYTLKRVLTNSDAVPKSEKSAIHEMLSITC